MDDFAYESEETSNGMVTHSILKFRFLLNQVCKELVKSLNREVDVFAISRCFLYQWFIERQVLLKR